MRWLMRAWDEALAEDAGRQEARRRWNPFWAKGFRQPKGGAWRIEFQQLRQPIPLVPSFSAPWKLIGIAFLFVVLGHLLPWHGAAMYFLPLFGMAQQALPYGSVANDPNTANDIDNREAWKRTGEMFSDLYSTRSRTISVGDDRFKSAPTKEARITMARAQAAAELANIVLVGLEYTNFDASLIDWTDSSIRMVVEGGDYTVYDVRAYGAAQGSLTNTYSFVAALNTAANRGGVVSVPCQGQTSWGLGAGGAASATAILQVLGGVTLTGNGGNQLLPVLSLLNGANRSMIEVPSGSNQGARVSSLRLEGNSANQSGTSHGVFCSNASPGNYMDSRTIFDNLFVHDFRTNGVITDANFGNSSWRDVIVRNCGAEGWVLNGTDAVFDNCQCNDAGNSGFKIQGWFNTFKACIAYRSAAYGFHVSGSGKYTKLIGCDSDSSNFDNYKVDADSVTVKACSTRDPGRAADATYSHIDLVSGLTGVNVSSTTWKARSLTNTAAYLLRANGALTQCHLEQTSWETGASTLGTLLFGTLTKCTIVRPTGVVTHASGDATPSVSGSGQFYNVAVLASAGSTPVTMFDDAQDGQAFTYMATGTITVVNGGTMQLQGGVNFAMVNGNTLSLVMVSGVWREMGRHT